ncbi:hypothetical protein GF361_01200 [Candidatus Woesearchaeota archaeon]|nr:hypothetical protein [Candidatus Woesearchaeota archaeon]
MPEKEKEEKDKNTIKIAVSASENDIKGDIDARFGRCPYFMIVEIENNKMKHAKAIKNTAAQQAGGAGISAAKLIADQDVKAVIGSNFGPRAFDVFNQLDIKVYQTEGKIKDAVKKYIKGELKEISTPTGPQHMGMGGAGQGQGQGLGRRLSDRQGQGHGRGAIQNPGLKQNPGQETIDRCVCTKCSYSMPAPKGIDCSQIKCPKCGAPMRTGGAGISPVEVKK